MKVFLISLLFLQVSIVEGISVEKCKQLADDKQNYFYNDYYDLGLPYQFPKCKDNNSNPRGSYTATYAPCAFKFHKIVEDGYAIRHSMQYRLPSACSDANVIDPNQAEINDTIMRDVATDQDKKDYTIEEYVQFWPDECVGAFQRCYHIERNEKIILSHFCKHEWNIPEGATHISVDCTTDKTTKTEQIEKHIKMESSDEYFKQNQKQAREFYLVITMLSAICIFSGFIGLFLIHKHGYKPYIKTLKMMKQPKSDCELNGLLKSSSNDHQ